MRSHLGRQGEHLLGDRSRPGRVYVRASTRESEVRAQQGQAHTRDDEDQHDEDGTLAGDKQDKDERERATRTTTSADGPEDEDERVEASRARAAREAATRGGAL